MTAPASARRDGADATTGRRLLERAVLAVGARPVARLAFLRWPLARTLLERAAWYVSDRIRIGDHRLPHTAVPLLHVLVRDAFDAYMRTSVDHPDGGQAALLAGFFKSLPYLVEVEVEGRDGRIWDPLAGQPLGEFLRLHGPASVRYDRIDQRHGLVHPKTFRTQMAWFLARPEELAELHPLLPAIVDP
jgi:hypothetical protein